MPFPSAHKPFSGKPRGGFPYKCRSRHHHPSTNLVVWHIEGGEGGEIAWLPAWQAVHGRAAQIMLGRIGCQKMRQKMAPKMRQKWAKNAPKMAPTNIFWCQIQIQISQQQDLNTFNTKVKTDIGNKLEINKIGSLWFQTRNCPGYCYLQFRSLFVCFKMSEHSCLLGKLRTDELLRSSLVRLGRWIKLLHTFSVCSSMWKSVCSSMFLHVEGEVVHHPPSTYVVPWHRMIS